MIKYGLHGNTYLPKLFEQRPNSNARAMKSMERSAKTNREDLLENIERQMATRAHVLLASNLFPSQVLA